jgi:chromosomal replication initiation ATPase DnaA
MTIGKAAQVLRRYIAWMRGAGGSFTPEELRNEACDAIDVAINLLEKNITKADIEDIIKAVERETCVTDEEMCGRSRHRETSEARAMVCWLSYRFTGMTLTAIGCRVKRDHATTLHYKKMVEGWLEDPRRNLRGSRIVTKLIRELEDDD